MGAIIITLAMEHTGRLVQSQPMTRREQIGGGIKILEDAGYFTKTELKTQWFQRKFQVSPKQSKFATGQVNFEL